MESANENSPSEGRSPGQQLVQLRQAAGLSLAYMAERMNLTEDYIAALEADEFEKLPPEPYVLGYYRTYARLLNVQPQPLLSSYRKLRNLPDEAPAVISGTERTPNDLHRRPMVLDRNTRLSGQKRGAGNSLYVIIAVALVAVWLLVSLLADKSAEVVITAPEGASVELAVPRDSAAGSPETLDSTKSTGDAPLSQEAEAEFDIEVPGETAAAPPEFPSASAGEAEPAAPVAAEPVVQVLDQLSFSFSGECWLEVTDANGDVLAATLYQNGDSAQLAGVAPFVIMLGNVRAVQLQLNGEAVALRAADNRKTLRMTLDKPKSAAAQ